MDLRRIASIALAGCALACNGPSDLDALNEVVSTADPSVDPARDPAAPFTPGERIDVGAADATTEYTVNTWARKVLMPGDLDGDGISDLAIVGTQASPPETVPCDDGCPAFDRAFVDIVYGGAGLRNEVRASARLASVHVHGLRWSAQAGGDIDGDERADLILGVYTSDCEQGNAYVIYGGARLSGEIDVRDGASMLRESGTCTQFGSVAGLGDVDGDGFDDFAVGAPRAENADGSRGRLYLYFGAAARPAERRSEEDAAAMFTDAGSMDFGSAERAGDVNGDGRGDFFVYGRDGNNDDAPPSRVWLVLGARHEGPIDVSEVGIPLPLDTGSVAALGDLDADGFADIGFTAITEDGRDGFVVRGRAVFPAQIAISDASTHIRRDPGRSSGFIAAGGDVNDDGRLEILYGDPAYQPTGLLRGAIYLFPGAPSGFAEELSLDAGVAFLGREFFDANDETRVRGADEIGEAMASGSDIDGDGIDDLVFVAAGAPESGRVYFWFGRSE
jgi:hypothetical protein